MDPSEAEQEEVRILLAQHREGIERELRTSAIISVLQNNGVLTPADRDAIVGGGKSDAGDGIQTQTAEVNIAAECSHLIDYIARNGFVKFKQFCFAIEEECPQLISELINDRLQFIDDPVTDHPKSDTILEPIMDNKPNIPDLPPPPRMLSPSASPCVPRARPPQPIPSMAIYSEGSVNKFFEDAIKHTSPVARRVHQTQHSNPQSMPPIYVNKENMTYDRNLNLPNGSKNRVSGLLCHQSATTSPLMNARKRDKLSYRFSDASTWDIKASKNKKNRRHYHSMNETIEAFADPVVEDHIDGDRVTWEYHTVSVTRVSGYGFGIAVSGGRDNPHFANGDPSIAVSDVLKGGPAEDRLQVNDRMISVNGVSLENVEYATAVQVLRDSGNTVTLMVKRRVGTSAAAGGAGSAHHHQSSNVHSTAFTAPNSPTGNPQQQFIKVVLSKNSKKEDFGIVLGCRLFVKEISSKARDQLAINGYSLQEGDIVSRINNTNTNDAMSLKEARKIIDSCKDQLNLAVLRDVSASLGTTLPVPPPQSPVYSHTAQASNCSNIADDASLFAGAGNSYSAQNLYVQPPTRPIMNSLIDEKSNLTPRGRSRNPLMDVSMLQLDRPTTPREGNGPRAELDPPRPPPPREEDFYASRRQLYEDDPLLRSKQSAEPRFISFQKEGSVGIRLTGGNEAGIFVTAVQPGSPASLQGLTPGDKILKVNDMDMSGVTREEAVLFLLSLQDRIELIVQHCREEYDHSVANQRGDSFHIKCHFNCDNPAKGEMPFKAGDIFRVVDTLHNGVVGAWQVMRIGRGQQEIQRGVIPNKARAEELATAQFNANKKGNNPPDSRTSFFKRRRPMHRRSKSLSRENWDDVVFSDSTISKFPAYERVVLRHPGFVRPLVLFGPVSDLARERLIKDFPDKFTAPVQGIHNDDNDDGKSEVKCGIVRLSNIRDITDRGKHALLDITPNAVDRLNYAQFYPIVLFLKAESKHQIKQLRQGIPKSVHKSSKKLFVQCQKLDQVWSHVFSGVLPLNDPETWYRKLRDTVDQLQSGAVWMSENKPSETLSDEFLFPMNTTSRLSYASSPESDLEMSPGPSTSLSLGNLPQLVKSCSDPSIATNQDNLERDREINGTETMPPPYNNHTENKYGFSKDENSDSLNKINNHLNQAFFGKVPELPPRIDRASKPAGGYPNSPPPTMSPMRQHMSPNTSAGGTYRRTAQERLFGANNSTEENQDFAPEDYATRSLTKTTTARSSSEQNTIDRNVSMSQKRPISTGVHAQPTANGSYDTVSNYGSFNNGHLSIQQHLGPNAPDDLKSVPPLSRGNEPPIPTNGEVPNARLNMHEHSRSLVNGSQGSPVRSPYGPQYGEAPGVPRHPMQVQRPNQLGLEMMSPTKKPQPPAVVETKTDYGKYSRNNSATQADYAMRSVNPGQPGGGGAFKPVPPPKPKNYQPMQRNQMSPGYWENGSHMEPPSPMAQNGMFYPPTPTHYHSTHNASNMPTHAQHQKQPGNHNNYGQYKGGGQQQHGGNSHYGGQPPMYGYPPQIDYPHHMNSGNDVPPLPPSNQPQERNALDLAGSREQRGSAFELYRKPQIGSAGPHHNMSIELESPSSTSQYAQFKFANEHPSDHQSYQMPPPPNLQHIYNMKRQLQLQQQQQRHQALMYSQYDPPPVPPPKPKKKSSILKSPFTALKKAFSKTKPLKRQNSMIETVVNPIRSPVNRGLRRQHSMMEPSRPAAFTFTPDLSTSRRNANRGYAQDPEYMTYHEPFKPNESPLDSSYQPNMETEAIYGNCGTTNHYDGNYNEDNVYANRNAVRFQRCTESQPVEGARSNRVVRRHSMADRHAAKSKENRPIDTGRYDVPQPSRYDVPPPPQLVDQNDDIYQTRSGAFMLDNAMDRRRHNNEEAIYQSRKEMHRDHLYQSRDEMHKRLQQGREDETQRSSHAPSRARSDSCTENGENELSSPHSSEGKDNVVYQSRKELKERGFKTRTQLRDHIYQSRREAMQSMAEPLYVSKRELMHDAIEESRESQYFDAKESNDEEREEADLSLKAVIDHLDHGFIENSESTQVEATQQSEENAEESESSEEDDDVTIKNANQSDLQKAAAEALVAPPTPRSFRDPYHISNMIKRTAPPASPIMPHPPLPTFNDNLHPHASRTSIETQFTSATVSSMMSLPTGPPAAQSTPYTSEMALPTFYPPLREQTTTTGVFDEHGGTLSDDVWNVSIVIPPGAIPAGRQQEIYFTVTDPRLSQTVGGPPLDMENGETMLSPLVMCGPQGIEFLRPVTLNIPHCAGRTASLGLQLKATDSEKNLCTNWDNIDMPSNAAAHTVSVKVDHF